MSQAQAENVIRNIIYELVQRGASRGHEVSETLAAFMIKAVVLDPRNGFDADRTLTSQDVQRLTEICAEKLTERCSPFLDTVKMQVYFDQNYTKRSEFVAEIHQVVDSKLAPLKREITDARVMRRDQVESLYRKITHYMLLCSGMGTLSDMDSLRQTTAALQSVFPQTEVASFMALLKKDKEQQLRDLSMLVTGIRIFTHTSQAKDTETLDVLDLVPEVLKEVLPVSTAALEQELGDCERLVWRFTSALETLTDPGTGSAEDGVSVELLRQGLYNVRQHQALLHILLADVRASVQRVGRLQSDLSTQILQLKDTVQSKTAIASARVYPLFRSLSGIWSALQDEAELLHIFRNLALSLRVFLESQAQIFPEQIIDGLMQGSEVKSDTERKSLCGGEKPIDPEEVSGPDSAWLTPENTVSVETHSLQYSGFCGHALVHRDGLLLPGSLQLGLLKHKEKLYAFSSRDAALQFASAPEHYISQVAERAKRSPELIQLLRLHRQFSCVTPYTELQSREYLRVQPMARNSCGTQTETHPVESYRDRTYEWNEWALRRKALQLADLRTRRTSSTQTPLSHLRRESSTQVYPPKDAAVQGMQVGGSSVPRPLVYLSGLRGQRGAPVTTVDLTRAVDE